MVDIVEREQGGPNKSFLKKHGLDEHSHPADWFNALMPLTLKDNLDHLSDVDVKGDGKTKFSISNWTSYTNQKAFMANAGKEGHIFARKYLPFNNEDITQMIGVYILDGLAPSHRLIQKCIPSRRSAPMETTSLQAALV